MNCPWGQKAFEGYFGDDKTKWKQHDATELVKQWKGPLSILIDVVCNSLGKTMSPVINTGINRDISTRIHELIIIS